MLEFAAEDGVKEAERLTLVKPGHPDNEKVRLQA